MPSLDHVGVLGTGAWGTALAVVAARAGRRVTLWGRDPALVAATGESRENVRHLPGVRLDPAIAVTASLEIEADLLLLACPAQALRALVRRLPATAAPLVICAKGLELATGLRLSQVIAAERPQAPVAVLSGPSFAAEVAAGLPTAVTLAAADQALGEALARALATPAFRLYWSDDVVGVELGGALKNVLAIAAGIVTGSGLGENARAALLTRGLAELTRLGQALGAREQTLMGLAGLGDLMLTATSLTSRNTSLGHALGQGEALAAILSRRSAVTEGVATAAAALALARGHGVELPVVAAVDAILAGRIDIGDAVAALLHRPLRAEH